MSHEREGQRHPVQETTCQRRLWHFPSFSCVGHSPMADGHTREAREKGSAWSSLIFLLLKRRPYVGERGARVADGHNFTSNKHSSATLTNIQTLHQHYEDTNWGTGTRTLSKHLFPSQPSVGRIFISNVGKVTSVHMVATRIKKRK